MLTFAHSVTVVSFDPQDAPSTLSSPVLLPASSFASKWAITSKNFSPSSGHPHTPLVQRMTLKKDRLKGLIAVQNRSFHKDVRLLATRDEWKTTFDVQGKYTQSVGGADLFAFEVTLDETAEEQKRMKMKRMKEVVVARKVREHESEEARRIRKETDTQASQSKATDENLEESEESFEVEDTFKFDDLLSTLDLQNTPTITLTKAQESPAPTSHSYPQPEDTSSQETTIQFSIRYESGGVVEWNNNTGLNFEIVLGRVDRCKPPRRPRRLMKKVSVDEYPKVTSPSLYTKSYTPPQKVKNEKLSPPSAPGPQPSRPVSPSADKINANTSAFEQKSYGNTNYARCFVSPSMIGGGTSPSLMGYGTASTGLYMSPEVVLTYSSWPQFV
jgi:Carbohydrate/starch-binding module (family 21)